MYLEYAKCGDLISALQKFQRFPVSLVRFYAAQVVLALEHLHSKSLIYRDLKPENILIGDDGYIKLADFGFIKRLAPWDRAYTFCGTPEYMAPEIVAGGGYGHSVDFWALGIMMFELMYGRPPFMGDDPMEIFKQIKECKLKFPSWFDKDARRLIRRFCMHDLTQRYGNLVGGS
jgi:serine/threonine protein kinase